MDDGSITGTGLTLTPKCFTREELLLLIDALNNNFSIKATINISNREKAQYTLYFSKSQLPLVRELVKDHMHKDMMYKLNLN